MPHRHELPATSCPTMTWGAFSTQVAHRDSGCGAATAAREPEWALMVGFIAAGAATHTPSSAPDATRRRRRPEVPPRDAYESCLGSPPPLEQRTAVAGVYGWGAGASGRKGGGSGAGRGQGDGAARLSDGDRGTAAARGAGHRAVPAAAAAAVADDVNAHKNLTPTMLQRSCSDALHLCLRCYYLPESNDAQPAQSIRPPTGVCHAKPKPDTSVHYHTVNRSVCGRTVGRRPETCVCGCARARVCAGGRAAALAPHWCAQALGAYHGPEGELHSGENQCVKAAGEDRDAAQDELARGVRTAHAQADSNTLVRVSTAAGTFWQHVLGRKRHCQKDA
jgi:hypothetical protein